MYRELSLLRSWLPQLQRLFISLHSSKYITTTVDIIDTIIAIDIMRIESTATATGVIIERD